MPPDDKVTPDVLYCVFQVHCFLENLSSLCLWSALVLPINKLHIIMTVFLNVYYLFLCGFILAVFIYANRLGQLTHAPTCWLRSLSGHSVLLKIHCHIRSHLFCCSQYPIHIHCFYLYNRPTEIHVL